MTLLLLRIPREPACRREWLDRQLLGPSLDRLVAELSLANKRRDETSLDQLLGTYRESVLAEGLAELPIESFGKLWRRPWLMLDLRERVLVEGGEYWDELLAEQPDLRESSRRVTAAVLARIEAAGEVSPTGASTTAPSISSPSVPREDTVEIDDNTMISETAPAAETVEAERKPFGRRKHLVLYPIAVGLALLAGVWFGPKLIPGRSAGFDPAARQVDLASVAARINAAGDGPAAAPFVRDLCQELAVREANNPDKTLFVKCMRWFGKLEEAAKLLQEKPDDEQGLESFRDTRRKFLAALESA